MATTSAPLVWSFYRQVGADSSAHVVGNVHYYDEWSQTIFLNGGVKTRTAEVPDGHWKDSTLSDPSSFINHASYHAMGIDHPVNGVLYGAAVDGEHLVFQRYIYGMELSSLMESWSWMSQNDNAISQFSGSVQNVGPDVFSFDATLFQPGAKVTLGITMGDSEVYPIGVGWLDECDYDISADTVEISGRNTVGYFLKDQTFDDNLTFENGASTTVESIFTYAGVKKFSVQPSAHVAKFTFKPEDTLLDGLATICAYYTGDVHEWKLLEAPDGTLCLGYQNWLSTYLPNTRYSFNEGSDVFKRKTTKLSDSSYVKIRATGKYKNSNNEEVELTPVTVPVNNFQYWALGAHRTKHLTAPDGFTQAELQTWAESQAAKYQYIGIGEDFTGPFRPQLIVGDIAEVVEGTEGTSLGVITEVRQVFSRKDGFKTEFSVDSGGVSTDGTNYVVYSRAAEVSGFNRRQRVIDLVRYIAKK